MMPLRTPHWWSYGLFVAALSTFLSAQEPAVRVPATVSAGTRFAISVSGQGRGTLYLLGPSRVLKREIEFGKDDSISGDDVSSSGIYQVVVCARAACATKNLEVQPAPAKRLGFLLHPSRVPVSTRNAVNATAITFDQYSNIAFALADVTFQISAAGEKLSDKTIRTALGIASFQMDSRPSQGTLEVSAKIDDSTEPRVIQQVASEACGLRMTAVPAGATITLQTDPIRDCKGNPLPDGTVVSFTKIDSAGKSTVDTPIKKDRAVVQFSVSGPARISVACGVVVGNEIAWGGRR
jgi:hypothetical protein